MIDDFTPLYRKASFWRFLFVWGLFFLFLFLFRTELPFAIKGFLKVGFIFIGNVFRLFNVEIKEPAVLAGGFDTTISSAMIKVGINIVFYVALYCFSLFMASQFTLPVRNWNDRKAAFLRLVYYRLGWYGLTAFVREGKLIGKTGEEDTLNPGVVLVDLSSAVVLSSQSWEEDAPPALRTSQFHTPRKTGAPFRVVGPGVNFIQYGEKVRSIIDLRKQVRTTLGVKAMTRDGIEIETGVFTVFSVSEPPDVIPVAYVGESDANHLFALELSTDQRHNTVTVKQKWSLDRQDAEEIHNAVCAGAIRVSSVFSSLPAFNKTITPYLFDKDRVFQASCADALNSSKFNHVIPWHELTQPICIDIFHSLLSHYTYDNLFSLTSLAEDRSLSEDAPTEKKYSDVAEFSKTLKAELNFRMRSQGILSYKLVKLGKGKRVMSSDQIIWNENPLSEQDFIQNDENLGLQFYMSAPYPLTNSKVMRDRAIKIIAAGFTQIVSPPEVRKQVIENWKARSEREIDITLAKYERDAMQVINNARTQMQRENAYHLSGIFNKGEHSDEALALLIFQALENIATNPKSRKDIPPKEILGMLQNLHRWLLAERKEIFKPPRITKGKSGEDDQ